MSLGKKLIYSIIIISGISFAQDNLNYLTLVSLNERDKLNQLENLEVPVFHISGNSLVTLLTPYELSALEILNIDYSILDQKADNDKYFLMASFDEVNIGDLGGEQIVYTDNESVIIKNIKKNNSELISNGLKALELYGERLFKNEKYVVYDFNAYQPDSLISQIVSTVDPDSVRYIIQSLQDFETRYLFASTRDSVANWIKAQFIRWGYTDVVIDSFEYNGTWQKNVVATLPGIYQQDVVNVFGGHHDSYSSGNPIVYAPGADDNASGTAAVLETARVLKEHNYQPESTIKFVTFAAEELGLWGSKDFAQKALNSGMNIKIMINHDMISHTLSPVTNSSVDINYYTGFEYLRELAIFCTETYSIIDAQSGSQNSGGSDSYSFWELGFPSVYFEESNFSPYWHTPGDTIGNYNMEYCAEVIKSSCATLLMNMLIPSKVENFTVVDVGNGNSLKLDWSPNSEPDLVGYKIYLGTSSGIYDSTYITTDTLYNLNGLITGTTYFIGLSAYDDEGYESIIVERLAVPGLLPLAPSGFTAIPKWLEVELYWNKNLEYDLLGYNLYRSSTEGELGDKLNSNVLADTMFIDNSAANGIYYYYTVKAVDSTMNESINNLTVKSRVVSLDQGILIVDETIDGDGTQMNPTDEQVDVFYNQLLANYNHQNYDLIEEVNIGIADLGAFSTVLWHGNDFQDLTAPFDFKDQLKEYLNYGGNLLYTGYRPGKAFEQASGNPVAFGAGDFIYDYLKIKESAFAITALFSGANKIQAGYNSIFVDSSKTNPVNDYHLRHIESINSSTDGINVYSFETLFDSTSNQGIFKGEPVGVEYIGTDFKTLTLSFPMYYMNQLLAQELIDYIMINKFNEIVSVEGRETFIPDEFTLLQNYPNPFNPSTTIVYGLKKRATVELKLFDILGREIEKIFQGEQEAGYHRVEFDASDLPSGIYFYQLRAGDFTTTKKMVLLR